MLLFGLQVIAVVLAVFLHHGNGRAITSTSNDNIERMLDLAEEEINTVLNETNENPTEGKESLAHVLRLSDSDSSSHEAVLFQFSDDVSGESANKGSGNVISLMEANPVWRHKRSLDDEPECYTGSLNTIPLTANVTITYPECRKAARFTACSGSKANNNNKNKRKCVPSNFATYSQGNVSIVLPTKCSCAP